MELQTAERHGMTAYINVGSYPSPHAHISRIQPLPMTTLSSP